MHYTNKITTSKYEIKDEKPAVNELIDQEKTTQLINNIQNSNISKNVKDFLILSAYRHLKFNYNKIAEYYAHANKENTRINGRISINNFRLR